MFESEIIPKPVSLLSKREFNIIVHLKIIKISECIFKTSNL